MLETRRRGGKSGREHVVITGIGAVTAHGIGWPRAREALARGESPLRSAGRAVPNVEQLPIGAVGSLDAFRTEFPEISPPLPLRETQMVLLAAREAMRDARLAADPPRDDVGVFLDRTWGPSHIVERLVEPFLAGGPQKVSPLVFSQTVANAPAGAVARHLGARGPNLTTMGGGALYLAVLTVRRGEATALLAGGFESIQPDYALADARMGRRRPLGEGAVVLVLEPADAAAARGAVTHAVIAGVAHGGDETDCVERALSAASIRASEVGARVDGLATLLGETLGMAASLSVAWATATATGPALVVETAPDGTCFAAVVIRSGP